MTHVPGVQAPGRDQHIDRVKKNEILENLLSNRLHVCKKSNAWF